MYKLDTEPIKDQQQLIVIEELLSEYREIVRRRLMAISQFLPRDKDGRRVIPMFFVNEIRAMNDHIARCFVKEKGTDEISKELEKAKGHLQRIEYDVYKQLNMLMYDKTVGEVEKKGYERMVGWYAPSNWNSFAKQYYSLKKEASQAVEIAKLDESLGKKKKDVIERYEKGVSLYFKLLELTMNNKQNLINLEQQDKDYNNSKKIKKVMKYILITTITTIVTTSIFKLMECFI